MRSLVKRIWPFSILYRLERKMDHMATQGEQFKAVLDSIVGHFVGVKASVESIQANLAAALKAAADGNQKPDPLLDAVLVEATDLNTKMGAFEDALKPHVDVPALPNPNPAPPEGQTLDPNGQPATGGNPQSSPTRADLDAALAKLPGDYTDPDYVVNNMRSFFGDLFTADDEAKVRAVVVAKPPQT